MIINILHSSIKIFTLQSSTDISDTSASNVESHYNSDPTFDKHRNKSHTLTSLDVESIVKPVMHKTVLHKKWTRKNNDGKNVDREGVKCDPVINIKKEPVDTGHSANAVHNETFISQWH